MHKQYLAAAAQVVTAAHGLNVAEHELPVSMRGPQVAAKGLAHGPQVKAQGEHYPQVPAHGERAAAQEHTAVQGAYRSLVVRGQDEPHLAKAYHLLAYPAGQWQD